MYLENVMPCVQGEVGGEQGGAQPKGLQEEAQAEGRLHRVSEQQHLLADQAQLEQGQHRQHLILPGTPENQLDQMLGSQAPKPRKTQLLDMHELHVFACLESECKGSLQMTQTFGCASMAVKKKQAIKHGAHCRDCHHPVVLCA